MPKYSEFQYGEWQKYGKYTLSTSDGRAIGKHVRYRIRSKDEDGKNSDWLTMCEDRISLPIPHPAKIRIRTNKGEWVYSQDEVIEDKAYRVRIRSIGSDGELTPWVYSERGEIKEL